MAMTLRIDEKDGELLEKIAQKRGVSRQKVLLQLVREESDRLQLRENPFMKISRISSALSSSQALENERALS